MVKTYSLGGRTVAINHGGEWTYLFQDHLGSSTLETDYDGNPGFRWKYEPYGKMRGTEWTLPIDRGFTGQVIERGLGLHDYAARHYAQPLGRWIAPDTVVSDPADPQSLNRYSYVGNRPTVYVDPSGRVQVCGGSCPQDWDELTHQWYAIQDQGLLDATILAWIQDHQNLATIEGMMAYLEANYGQTGAILPASFNTMFAHGIASGNIPELRNNPAAELLAGVIFAGVATGTAAYFGGIRKETAPASGIYFSQQSIKWTTRDGVPIDDLAQDIAQGWRGGPLRVIEIDDHLVSLDNRRLAAAKLLDIEVPISRLSLDDLAVRTVWQQRDGIFSTVRIRGTNLWIW